MSPRKPLPKQVQKFIDEKGSTEIATRLRVSEYVGDHSEHDAPRFEPHWDQISQPYNDSVRIDKIEVWTAKKHIKGIQISYAENKLPPLTYNTIDHASAKPDHTFVVPADERIVRLYLYAGINDYGLTKTLYAIKVFTDNNEDGQYLGYEGQEGAPDILELNAPEAGWSLRGFWMQAGDAIDRLAVFWGLDKAVGPLAINGSA
jgi:hypothetical protein